MKTIFICSPYRVDVKNYADQLLLETNIKRVETYAHRMVKEGNLPLAPHLYFTQFLDDQHEVERQQGIELGLKWLEESDEVHVLGDTITKGMKQEIDHAEKIGKYIVRVG